MNPASFTRINVQDYWSLAIANESRHGREKCPVCQRESFTLNYSKVWVPLDKEDLADIKRQGWPATIGSLYHIAVRQDLKDWLLALPNHGLAFHPLELRPSRRTPDAPDYWLHEPLGEFDMEVPEEEFETCPGCGMISKTVPGEVKGDMFAPREGWSGHLFAHPRKVWPWMTYVLAGMAEEIAASWPEAFRFNRGKRITLR